ncbi:MULTISPECIES: hypothetical protein [Cupriavidus]
MKIFELKGDGGAAASKAIRNRTKEVIDEFDLDTDLSGTPKEAFSRALAELSDKQLEALIEVARRAYRAGAKRGALSALDAVIEAQIEIDLSGNDVVLTTTEKALRFRARTLTISGADRGEDLSVPIEAFSISREKLGFK